MEKNGPVRSRGLAKIQMPGHHSSEVCHDDSTPPVRAQTIEELHSLQKKKSAPTTPIRGTLGAFASISEEDRYQQQLQSIR
jgi:phosphoenolpyruvate carboxykinase (ATP)